MDEMRKTGGRFGGGNLGLSSEHVTYNVCSSSKG